MPGAAPEGAVDDPLDEERLGLKFVRLARVLNCSVSNAFAYYNLVKGRSGSRMTIDALADLLAGLSPVEQLPELVIARIQTGGAPDAPVAASRGIEWVELTAGSPPAPSDLPPVSRRLPRRRKERPVQENKTSDSRIEWGAGPATGVPDYAHLVGIEDAFEHTPLLAGEKVAYCQYDRVAYHLSTWNFLRAENGGRCCACGRSGTIILVALPGKPEATRIPLPDQAPSWLGNGQEIILLRDVWEYIGQAVVVQDTVQEVYRTMNTGTYFVRFEERKRGDTPFGGFKVVIFPRYEAEWQQAGLSPFMYEGHPVRVRGVIQNHPTWGIEILVNSPRVIQILENLPEET